MVNGEVVLVDADVGEAIILWPFASDFILCHVTCSGIRECVLYIFDVK
jgi:hypothetical protein